MTNAIKESTQKMMIRYNIMNQFKNLPYKKRHIDQEQLKLMLIKEEPFKYHTRRIITLCQVKLE